MHKAGYILPVATVIAVFAVTWNISLWWVYLIALAVSEAVVYLLFNGISKDREFISGYATQVRHYNAWTERVTHTETYTVNGKTQTRTRVSYVHHPEYWAMPLNTGTEINISHRLFEYCSGLWGTGSAHFNTFHPNCVMGGGGQSYDWDGIEDHAQTATYTQRYKNYLQYSHSIYRGDRISRKEARSMGLFDYPNITDNEQRVICLSPELNDFPLEESDQVTFQRLNAFVGKDHQVHFLVLLFTADKGINQALYQRDYWEGGNKNEFTTCLGIRKEGDAFKVAWCKPFSWMDTPTLETAAMDWFISNPILDLNAYAAWLRENIGLWKRKEFKDFKYLGRHLSKAQTILYYILTALVCAAAAFALFSICRQ